MYLGLAVALATWYNGIDLLRRRQYSYRANAANRRLKEKTEREDFQGRKAINIEDKGIE